MHPASDTPSAAWQVAPVSARARIVAATLAALAVASVFAWSAAPNTVEALLFTVIPCVVAIRVIRGFEGSLAAATVTFAGTGSLAGYVLDRASLARPTLALFAVIVLSITGLAVLVANRLDAVRARHAVIRLSRRDEGEPVPVVVRRTTR